MHQILYILGKAMTRKESVNWWRPGVLPAREIYGGAFV